MSKEEQEKLKSLDSFTLDFIHDKIIDLQLKNIENRYQGYEYKDRAYQEIVKIISEAKINTRTIQKLKKRRTSIG